MEIKEQDILWMKERYGELRVKNLTNIVGTLRFRAAKSQHNEIMIWHELPSQGALADPHFIEDAYEVDVYFGPHELVPIVREEGGRLEKRAQELEVDIIELHVFPQSNTLCLGAPVSIYMEMKSNPGVKYFFEKFLIPYFYKQSYEEKYGHKSWPDHPHNEIPIFEDFYRYRGSINKDCILISRNHLSEESKMLLLKGKMSPNMPCLCGSGRKIKNCHEIAWLGFNLLSRKIRCGLYAHRG